MSKKNSNFAAENLNAMPKQNTALLLSRYIWLIDTIYSAGHITREEINRRWCRSLLSEGEMEISERTFHRYRDAIAELFQIDIAFSKSRGYYIENTTDFQRNDLRKHIAFEAMPSGQQYLTTILEAIRERVRLRVTHQGFNKEHATTFTIAPYGLKVFKQRWYVLAASEYPDGRLLVYSLDRFSAMERTEEKYEIPEDFDIDEHFRLYYGVSGHMDAKAEIIRLRIDASQVKFFRTLPLHPSQTEIETTDAYSVFEYYMIPTFELTKEILSNTPYIEVLLPQSLREEIQSKAKQMAEMYK